jgi:hypothetical protein
VALDPTERKFRTSPPTMSIHLQPSYGLTHRVSSAAFWDGKAAEGQLPPGVPSGLSTIKYRWNVATPGPVRSAVQRWLGSSANGAGTWDRSERGRISCPGLAPCLWSLTASRSNALLVRDRV